MGWFKKDQEVERAPSATPGSKPSSLEAQNSRRMEEKRTERDKKVQAAAGSKFVIDGAKVQCNLCSNPLGTLKVLADRPMVNDLLMATESDKSAMNVMFTGTCLKSPNAASPCAAVMQLGKWKDTGKLLVQDEAPLLLKSTIMCMFGGCEIKIIDCGQRN